MSKKIACSWSGGKDACLALIYAVEQGFQPVVLFNIMNENGRISRSHALPISILEQQSQAANIPMVRIHSTWEAYEENFILHLKKLKQDFDIEAVVFGDLDLEAHRLWEEKVCAAAGLECILPLWGKTERKLHKKYFQKISLPGSPPVKPIWQRISVARSTIKTSLHN